MGYCGTSGSEYIDYIVTDKITSPPQIVEKYYSEKAIYLPDCYYLNDHAQSSKQVLNKLEHRP